MPVTAGDLVDQVRDFHPSFDRRQAPDRVVLRQLSRYQRRLAEKVTVVTEEALAVPVTFTREQVDAAAVGGIAGAGLPLPEYLLILAVNTRYVTGGPSIPVSLVAYSNNRSQALRDFPSAYLIRQALYPVSRLEASLAVYGENSGRGHGWEQYDGLSMLVVPVPPELTTLESQVTLPHAAHDALVTATALWLAQRQGVLAQMPSVAGEARDAEATAVASLGSQDTTSTWSVVRTG